MTEMQDTPGKDAASSDEFWLELLGIEKPDLSQALADYINAIANRELRRYRKIIQWGAKAGQTYYSHILDGVMTLGRLFSLQPLGITDTEARCLLLAFTVHDINKLDEYGKDGRRTKAYPDAATSGNIDAELMSLDASSFFSEWRRYLADIAELAHLHQGHDAVTLDRLDRRSTLLLDEQAGTGRVKQLGYLIQAVDELDLSKTLDERNKKDQFLFNLNAACLTEQYQFITHRLSEYRGVLTNVIHNGVVNHLRAKYPACLDLLYYPDGVAYLIPQRLHLTWDDTDIVAVAQLIERRLAALQADQLGQFIKGRPFGIAVDKAAIESGATPAQLLDTIYSIVMRKTSTADRLAEREQDLRNKDLLPVVSSGQPAPDVAASINAVLALPQILPTDEMHIRCGEFITAYRNLVGDHSADLGLQIKDSWEHLYEVLELPKDRYPLYKTVHTFRRGFFLARDLPEHLATVDALYERFLRVFTSEVGESEDSEDVDEATDETAGAEGAVSGDDGSMLVRSLADYLRRTLIVSANVVSHDFSGYLREYVTAQNRQCCNCSTMLPTQNWMSANVPASIGVQGFSNRLAGGGLVEPKRRVCPICRAQFILEKIAWAGHSSKMGLPKTGAGGAKSPGYTTFYLYLYPHTYFTAPFLQAWINEMQRLRDMDSTAFYINIAQAFRVWATKEFVQIPIIPTKINGVALPQLAEATRNIPLLPINAPGQNYGEQFLVALEKAVLLRAFFGCRVVLSRLPTSPIDANSLQTIFVDGLPRNLLWLVTGAADNPALYQHEANLSDDQVNALEKRLQLLHQLRDALYIGGSDRDLVHDLAVETGDDSLRLYYTLDRAIEEKVAAETRGGRGKSRAGDPDREATALSHVVTPLARELLKI
jgi:CRISPR-associated protein Csc3